MSDQGTLDAVRRSVTVPLAPEQAFELFVDEFGSWWPLGSHHIGARAPDAVIIEPREGGRWYERDDSGNECDWGMVLALERPSRILLGWQLTPNWEFDPDPRWRTEVEVTFEAHPGESTSVTLEHRGFDVYGPSGASMRESVAGEGGWAALLDRYAERASQG